MVGNCVKESIKVVKSDKKLSSIIPSGTDMRLSGFSKVGRIRMESKATLLVLRMPLSLFSGSRLVIGLERWSSGSYCRFQIVEYSEMYRSLAQSPSTFVNDMTTYYCTTIEEALRRVKRAVKVAYPGCYFGGITLRSGKRGFAIYKEGKVIEQYTFIGR